MKTHRLLLLSLAIPFVLGACSADRDGSVLAPNATYPADTGRTLAPATDSEWIGPAGGYVSVLGCKLTVPAGALSVATLITLTKNADGSVELSPHGQTFAVDVELSFVAPLISTPTDYNVQWFNPGPGKWMTIPSSAVGFARVSSLEHFSLYKVIQMTR